MNIDSSYIKEKQFVEDFLIIVVSLPFFIFICLFFKAFYDNFIIIDDNIIKLQEIYLEVFINIINIISVISGFLLVIVRFFY